MEASLIAANVAAGCLIAVFAYAGWHTLVVEQRRRRAVRERIRLERAQHEDLALRILRSRVRCELLPRALAAQCDVILRTQFVDDNYSRKVPELTELSADDFALLAGDVR